VIAVDTNILVYAHVRQSPWYPRASQLLGDLAASGSPWAIPVHCLNEFFAVVTHPRIYKPASAARDAIAQIDAWTAAPAFSLLGEDAGSWAQERDLALDAKLVGAAIHDARIAAVCIQNDVAELWTSDRDFSRFPALRTRNPLVGSLPTRAGELRARYRIERRGRASARSIASR
jgi:toxin-antitoxin system PIN domain toxin